MLAFDSVVDLSAAVVIVSLVKEILTAVVSGVEVSWNMTVLFDLMDFYSPNPTLNTDWEIDLD